MKKIYKRIFFIIIMAYFVFTLISQQKALNSYKTAEANYSSQLKQAQETNKTLVNTKENVTSLDYIKEVAREKLDMYLPNERVYVDIEK